MEATIAAAMIGACAGFLWFNAAPARIFMGRYRIARHRYRHRDAGVAGECRSAAADHRRAVRHRGAVGDHPGRQLPAISAPGIPHGAHPSPLRAAGVAGDDRDHPVLDPGRIVHGSGAGAPSTPISCPKVATGDRAPGCRRRFRGQRGQAVGPVVAGRRRRHRGWFDDRPAPRMPRHPGDATVVVEPVPTGATLADRLSGLRPGGAQPRRPARSPGAHRRSRGRGAGRGPRSSWRPASPPAPAGRAWSPSPAPTGRRQSPPSSPPCWQASGLRAVAAGKHRNSHDRSCHRGSRHRGGGGVVVPAGTSRTLSVPP